MRRIGVAILGTLLLASCATITTGTHEKIRVSSSPSQADATLVCEGRPSGEGKTPVTFEIRRNAGDCTLTLRKEGFEQKTIAVQQGVNPAYWGNMLFSWVPPAGLYVAALGDSPNDQSIGVGLLGAGLAIFGTDFWTGAVHAHKPHNIDAVLKPK
jgi:hypothetical protein